MATRKVKTVKRVLLISGNSAWVDQTLALSLVAPGQPVVVVPVRGARIEIERQAVTIKEAQHVERAASRGQHG